MHHQPEPAVLVRLKFHEMITAAECCELHFALLSTDGIQDWMAESIVCHVFRLRNDQASISPAGRHRMAKFSQDLTGDLGRVQGRCVKIEGNGKHATSDVASHRLRIDQVRGGDNHTNANVSSQMHIGHYGDLLYIRGATEALQRLRNLVPHWRREPSPHFGH